jgi:orotidine-5'-phosphate decarboxylase
VLNRLRKFGWLVPGIGAQGGDFSSKLKQRAEDSSSTLIAISRDLSGDMQHETLGFKNAVKSWADFEIQIAGRATDYLQQIRSISLD